MDIIAYNQQFNPIGIIDNFTSFRWVRRYQKCGEFELVCPLTKAHRDLLVSDNIISPMNADEAAFINYRIMSQDDEGKETLTVKGLFLNGYLARRIVWGSDILKATTSEVVMRTLVDKNCINPTDSNRVIPNFELGDLVGFTGNIDYQMAYKNLQDEIETICTSADLGYRIVFDKKTKKIRFEIYQGIDKSSNQSENQRCIFSRKFENVTNQEFSESTSNFKNVCLVGGKTDDNNTTDRKFVTLGSETGIYRREVFCDQGGLSQYDGRTKMSNADYDALLTTKGSDLLSKMVETLSFDGTINMHANLEYKKDFDVGDKVNVIDKDWGVSLDTRIMEIEENYDVNGFELKVIFGDEAPTLIGKFKLMALQSQNGYAGSSDPITSIDGGVF